MDVTYSVQTNPLLYNKHLPDPVLGVDRAHGCKNWVEVDGKQIEFNGLTGDEPDEAFSTDRFKGYEGFQYLDLGQERKILALNYFSGNGNRQFKVDFSASDDGKTYTPIEGLQGFNIHGVWGGPHPLPVAQPINARFLKLHYHNDGNQMHAEGHYSNMIVLNFISKLYVYDGPQPGEIGIAPCWNGGGWRKTAHVTAQPHNFALLSLATDKPLQTGSYYFGAMLKTPGGIQLYAKNYFARSAQEVKIGPDSRFGMNGNVPGFAQQLKRLGVGWIRYGGTKWSLFNTAAGEFNYERTDGIPLESSLERYHEAGLSVLPFIDSTPTWAASGPDNKRKSQQPPTDYEDYGKAIFETVARYGSTTHPERRSPHQR